MANIRAKGSGPISLRGTDETDGIAEQFGGTKPDGVSEYYRAKDYGTAGGGVVVADSTDNVLIAKSGAQKFSNYYGTGKTPPMQPGPPGFETIDEIDNAFGEKPDGSAETPKETLSKGASCLIGSSGRAFSRNKQIFAQEEDFWASSTKPLATKIEAYLDISIDNRFAEFLFPKLNLTGSTPYKYGRGDDARLQNSKIHTLESNFTVPGADRHNTPIGKTTTRLDYKFHLQFMPGGYLYYHRSVTSAMINEALKNWIFEFKFTNSSALQGNHLAPFSLYGHVDMTGGSVLMDKPANVDLKGTPGPPPNEMFQEEVILYGSASQQTQVRFLTDICMIPYNKDTKGAVIAEYGGFDPWNANNGKMTFPKTPLTAPPYVPPPPYQPMPPGGAGFAKDVIVLRFKSVTKPLTFGGAGGAVSSTIVATFNGAPRVGLTVYIMGKWIGAPGTSWSSGAKLAAVGAGGTTNAAGEFSTSLTIPPKPAGAVAFWVGCTYLTTGGGNVAGTPDSRRVIP